MDGPTTLLEAVEYFSHETNCINYLAAKRWPDVSDLPDLRRGSRSLSADAAAVAVQQPLPEAPVSIKARTMMENSPISLDKWLPVLWLIANCPNGVSSWEIHRDLGVTQKTAWFTLHRVRLRCRTI